MGERHCLNCDRQIHDQTATDGSGATPVAGNISICLYCANIAVYDLEGDDLVIRAVTEEEREDLERDTEVLAMVAWVKSLGLWMNA